jgi:hypothetical protein
MIKKIFILIIKYNKKYKMAYAQEKLKTVISVPTSSSILTVDTRDGLTYDSQGYPTYKNPYDIDIYKNSPIFRGKINRIALTNFSMKYTTPNVNPYNNVLFLDKQPEQPGDVPERYALFMDTEHLSGLSLEEASPSSSLQPGFYTPEILASSVQNALNAGDGVFDSTSWTCSWVKDSENPASTGGRFRIGNTTIDFKINPMGGLDKGTFQFQTLSNPPVKVGPIYKRTSTLAQLMGFDNISSSKAYSTFWFSGIASMNYTSYIDVISNTITINQFTRDVSTDNNTGYNLLARIYINQNLRPNINKTLITGSDGTTVAGYNYTYDYPGMTPMMINWEAEYPKQIRWDKEAFLAGVQIQLKDDMGNLLYFQDEPVNLVSQYGDTGYALMTFMISEQDD